MDSEWFFYSGDIIPTSRCFCIERHNRYFYYKEIESWADGEGLGECDLGGGDWSGKNPTTNKNNIYILAGGFFCQHSILPVTIDQVDKETIQRAIEKFGYEPTEFEKQELGI